MNVYGTWIPFPPDCAPEKGVRSILAQCAQAAEMKLLAPVIDLAVEWEGRSSGFDIMLWQHDGFSFVPNKHEDTQPWTERLQCAVKAQADHLQYKTCLDVAESLNGLPDDATLNPMCKRKRFPRCRVSASGEANLSP